ncbi:zf-TFIIB domain-containing protein [Cohnella hongkongensis]|uniref:Zf-TFIIB domain-containing protein n=1 Tax=Cohnella hongkongensis TaxID=178337 RepID=A0ABV9FGF7_9BACL
MNCPVCDDTRMREVEKNGILIDVCPTCKGVWLDRGELEKLMQDVREVRQDYNQWYYGNSSGAYEPPRGQQPPQQPYPPQQSYPPQQPYPGHGRYPYKKKKKSVMDLFGDLFD